MAAKPNQIEIIRVYDAPMKLVWEAWTDLNHVSKWWGPRGFTITTKSKDLRPGGKWIYTMHGPDGTDYPNITTYHVVEKYKRLSYDHGGNEERQKLFSVDVTFTEELGKTIMTMFMTLDTPEAAKEIKKFIKMAGGNATWDRLAEHLDHVNSHQDTFVINRSFEAPIERVFELWTRPEHLSKWLPPQGLSMVFVQGDIRSGGVVTYYMTADEKARDYVKAYYYEVTPSKKIVFSQQFIQEDGKVTRHSSAPVWPESMLTTVSFAEEGAGQTRVTLKWEAAGTEKEMVAFRDERPGMTVGWTGSFDKLEEIL